MIPKGAKILLFYASANRDPAKFAEPDRFDIRRNTTGHLAFGHGLHFCLGAHLARLEAVTAIDCLLDEVDGLQLAGPGAIGYHPFVAGAGVGAGAGQATLRSTVLDRCAGSGHRAVDPLTIL